MGTVEAHIEETRFFPSSLDRFLICGLILLIPACKVLNKVLIHSTCSASIYTIFSQLILDDSWEHFKVRILV